jgi:hypothetical protein
MSHLGYCGEPESISIKQPDRPTQSGATTVFFDSATMFGVGQLRQMNATLLEVTAEILDQNSRASGFAALTSTDGGTTYTANTMRNDAGTATMPITITASDAPRTYRFVISPYKEFRLTGIWDAVPSTWTWTIVLHTNSMAVAR